MTTPQHADRTLFVTLPIADPERSQDFFAKLGFTFDPAFSNEDGICMPVGEQARVMLVRKDKWAELSKLPAADPTKNALALFCFNVASRDEVNAVADAAIAAGGVEVDPFEDHGDWCARSFFDLDGHGWQVMWMNATAAE